MKARSYTMHRLATDESARRAVIDAVRAKPNGEIHDVERAIAAYEAKYGMSSANAVAAIERGELRPTQDVEGWMMVLRVRDHLADVKARSR
jgi:hypothetical protein